MQEPLKVERKVCVCHFENFGYLASHQSFRRMFDQQPEQAEADIGRKGFKNSDGLFCFHASIVQHLLKYVKTHVAELFFTRRSAKPFCAEHFETVRTYSTPLFKCKLNKLYFEWQLPLSRGVVISLGNAYSADVLSKSGFLSIVMTRPAQIRDARGSLQSTLHLSARGHV